MLAGGRMRTSMLVDAGTVPPWSRPGTARRHRWLCRGGSDQGDVNGRATGCFGCSMGLSSGVPDDSCGAAAGDSVGREPVFSGVDLPFAGVASGASAVAVGVSG